MKIYVATAFPNRDEAKAVIGALQAVGHEITHDWTNESLDTSLPQAEQDAFLAQCGAADFEGVRSADALVLVNDPRCRDAMTEFGIAIGRRTPVFVMHRDRRVSVFFDLPGVYHVDSIESLTRALADYTSG